MSDHIFINDALAINTRLQKQRLIDKLPPNTVHYELLQNASTIQQLLPLLSGLLAQPRYTQLVATLFRPILLDLCARWIGNEDLLEDAVIALSYLVEVHEELFPVLNHLLQHHTKSSPLSFIAGSLSPTSVDTRRLQCLLLAYYRILQANRELPSQLLWSPEPLSMIIWTPHLDNAVRLLAIRCYALQTGMGEDHREKMESEVLGKPCGVDCALYYGETIFGDDQFVDAWIMPAIELKRIQNQRIAIVTDDADYFSGRMENEPNTLTESDLCLYTANVHGILLLRSLPKASHPSSLIPLPSSIDALQKLALNISRRLPTLLTSAPSAGKALLLSHIAGVLYPERKNQVVTIHLADTSLDPRGLLGSYVSSTVQPGTFDWKEGVLIRSMREGRWIVFEDIDRGSNEVLGVIKPLIETMCLGKWIGARAKLSVPGRGDVDAHDDFMVFATRSTPPGFNDTFHSPSFFGSHKFTEVILRSPSSQELRTIVSTKYPHFSGGATECIVNLWESVLNLSAGRSVGRDMGVRELLKFCQRISALLPAHSNQDMDIDSVDSLSHSFAQLFPNISLREDIFLQARDVFFGGGTTSTSTRLHAETVARTIGDALALDHDRQQWVIEGKLPEIRVEKNANGGTTAIRFGSIQLPALPAKGNTLSAPSRPFAMHKPAIKLLARIATAVFHGEPLLLTGETGTGKTSVVSYLAASLNRPLISLNLSHQTETSDLIGGLKPIDTRIPGSALQGKFIALFGATFSRKKNEKFETEVRKAVNECKWKRAVGLWKESVRLAMERIQAKTGEEKDGVRPTALDEEAPRKRRKVERPGIESSREKWTAFLSEVEEFEVQHVHGKGKFAFGFVEGPLLKALRSGAWILLDEINLASPETLESLSGLLDNPNASITLTEHGSLEPIPRHPDFRIFACMNPATDVGKKDLPPPIRTRFTEIDVPPPDADKETLLSIISQYIGHIAVGDKGLIMDVAEFYTAVKQVAESRKIADGANHRPHFSMRTLVRALTFAADTASSYSLRRSIWEGCLMAFTMVLDSASAEIVTGLARKYLLSGVRNPRALLSKDPSPPEGTPIKFGPFYLARGPLDEDSQEGYVMTPSVEQKLIDLARIILTRKFPVLIEGPTSSGKTSSIEYLANRTGHRFVRINNHDHTDIQEYLGSYVSDPITGKLVFKDGLLVQALRFGHWIVLDELNLAPTDVLEALNRLLDDNRELVIPETHEVIRPHPNFMLFATQNPPGLYAGRKVLSRAFRNRFLEVHFDDVPQDELETILCQRCQIAPSYGKKIVTVFRELQKRRQTGRVFESKQGFATLRDLFRWAGRDAVGYQELAENGYMLLAERTRRSEDKEVVKEVIESVMNVKIDEQAMYELFRPDVDMQSFLGRPVPSSPNLVWTKAMQRLYILVCRGLKFNEPILLVGETGSGKTSVCQVYADAASQRLLTLNCHQNTETADLIGGLRPVRNRSSLQNEITKEIFSVLKEAGVEIPIHDTIDFLDNYLTSVLKGPPQPDKIRASLESLQSRISRLRSIFEWHNGPLIEAMSNGDAFLVDEISLADDSVLERLNSVLEPGRSIVLAERGGADSAQLAIVAADNFKLIATMNPGGDYGKKELSPALRNRFTEIWVPAVDNRQDLELIVNSMWHSDNLRSFTAPLLDFIDWLCLRIGDRSLMSLRDILAWVVFVNSSYHPESKDGIGSSELFHHAAHMTYLDGLSSLPQLSGYSREALQSLKTAALFKLQELVPLAEHLGSTVPEYNTAEFIQLGSFAIPRGRNLPSRQVFNFAAPTTLDNAMRIVRACQVAKPILLEGSPGVGKTSLITALANLSGHHLCRINLSNQTDLIDLFGSDLPVEGGCAGEFAWKDAEFLKALQEGHWVLLDEMNLAPQGVLEGVNAILDHRGTVYIPELNRSFAKHPSFRIFAAQNPLHQGGGRKGLPKSFVNRFTKVYVEELTATDLYNVCSHIFPDLEGNLLRAMIAFNVQLAEKVTTQHAFAQDGSPWEFNLRDIVRWGTLLTSTRCIPQTHLRTVYLQRFRNAQDRKFARSLFDEIFCSTSEMLEMAPPWILSPREVQIGSFKSVRLNMTALGRPRRVLKSQLPALESLGHCVSQSSLAILTGPKNSGKSDIVRALANMLGASLVEVSLNSGTDTMDILGSFEQVDIRKHMVSLIDDLLNLLSRELRTCAGSKLLCHYWTEASILRRAVEDVATSNVSALLRQAQLLCSALVASESNTTARFQAIEKSLSRISTSAVGRFEWTDGPLVKAMKSGQWLLLDGANLCGPSVLDRLNSLCEAGGTLVLSERGFVDGEVQLIKPHPNFRLFMTVDPNHGELSRAMRNRGIEIALFPEPLADDVQILQDYYRLPTPASHTTNQGINTQHTSFELLRRGLTANRPGSTFPRCSSGHYLDQDSALSNLVDQVAVALSLLNADDASLKSVLSRTLIPACLPYLTRYIVHDGHTSNIVKDFVIKFPGDDLNMALQPIRIAHILRSKEAEGSILFKPMYFYWDQGISIEDIVKPDIVTPRAYLLETLDLASSLLWWKSEPLEIVKQKPFPRQKDQQVGQAVLRVYREAVNVASNVLLMPYECTPSSKKLASRLLSYLIYLKKAFHSTSLDFSALYAISNWFLEALKDSPDIFKMLCHEVNALHDAVSLSTGLGLFSLWAAFYIDDLPKNIRERITTTDLLSSTLVKTCDTYGIRYQTFNALSLESLPSLLQLPEQGTLEGIRTSLNEVLTINVADIPANDSRLIDPRSIILELNALASWLKEGNQNQQNLRTLMHEIISLTCQKSDASLLRIVPYQHLAWSSEVGSASKSLQAQTTIQWLDGLWNLDVGSSDISGPAVLLHPILMHDTIFLSDMNHVNLLALATYDGVLRQQAQLAISQSQQLSSRIEQLSIILFQNIVIVVSAFSSSFDRRVYERIQEVARNVKGALSESLTEILVLLQTSNDTALVDAVKEHMLYMGTMIAERTPLQALGLIWVGLSRMLSSLVIPDAPVDPAAVHNFLHERLVRERDDISAQISIHEQLECLVTGNDDNDFIRYLGPRLTEIQETLSQLPTHPIRNDVSRLRLFWSEVSQFQTSILSTSKLDPLITALLLSDPQAFLREQVMQESLRGFYQRLDSVYPEYADISNLLKLSVLYMRLGLRVVVESVLRLSPNVAADLVIDLTAFPSIQGSSNLITSFRTVRPPENRAFRHVLLVLSAISLENRLGPQSIEHIEDVYVAYEQAVGLWLIDKAKDKKEKEEGSTLYRTVNYSAVTDLDLEEEEFLAMFPRFEDVLEKSNDPGMSREAKSTSLVMPEHMKTLLHVHYDLTGVGDQNKAAPSIFFELKAETLHESLLGSVKTLPELVDEISVPYQLTALHNIITSLNTKQNHTDSYNFYLDPNYHELRRAASVVTSLRKRLVGISQEWPDQMVLHNLIERCDTILNMSSRSSIAKAISGLEQLLVQSEDWEMYSNRYNSIKPNQEELVGLIVDWRRLELACWQTLLDAQEKYFADEISEWWFRLYDAVIRVPLNTAQDSNDLDQYLDSLIPLLDDFITSSPLGQFHPRMKLIESFERFITLLTPFRLEYQRATLERVRRILNSLTKYYNLFVDHLHTRLADEKETLVKEIKKFVKLASWKDVNVQALKQSAQRTHRQLFKIARNFRDVLRQPITTHIQPFLGAGKAENQALQFDRAVGSVISPPLFSLRRPNLSSDSGPTHLLNLQRTFVRCQTLVTTQLRPFIAAQNARCVDDIAVEIISTSNSLASLSVPPEVSVAKRDKYRKSLLVRKQKALADLLKELKRAGLASNIKPEILRQNTDQKWLRGQPILSETQQEDINAQQGDTYFIKLCGCLPSLRQSLPHHHADITTRELQRGHMFVESGFSMGVDLRSRLIHALTDYFHLKRIFERLRALTTSPNIVRLGCDAVSSLNFIKNGLHKTSYALLELRHNADSFNQLKSPSPLPPSFFEGISDLVTLTDSLASPVDSVLGVLHATKLHLLTQAESDMCVEAENHFNVVFQKLCIWSQDYPELTYLLLPLSKWLALQRIDGPRHVTEFEVSEGSELNALLNSLLVCVQSLVAKCSRPADTEDDPEKYIVDGYLTTREFTHHLNLYRIKTLTQETLHNISLRADLSNSLNTVIPFLSIYLDLAKEQLISHNNWTKAIFKLDFVICSLFYRLTQEGFCQPPESGDSDEKGLESEQTGGVGIGEGIGKENVSKDIEDESQVEGLNGEDTESHEPEGQHEGGDAIEMADDFGGELEDVDEPGSDHEEENKSENEDEADLDETIGDLEELDPAAVDEKLWGDEKGPEGDNLDETTNQDHSKEQNDSSEVAAKESKEKKQSKDQPKDDKQSVDIPEVADQDQNEVGDEADQPTDPEVNGEKMDDYTDEANTLDLPDGINMEDELANEEERGGDDFEDFDDHDAVEDNQSEIEDGDQGFDDPTPTDPVENDPASQPGAENEDIEGLEPNRLHSDDEMESAEQEEEEGTEASEIARPDLSKEGGLSDPTEAVTAPEAGESSSTGEAGTSQGRNGEAAPTDEKVTDDEGPQDAQQTLDPTPADDGKGSGSSGIQKGQVPTQSEVQSVTNPLRSLGDTLDEIRQRFDEILHSKDDNIAEEIKNNPGEAAAQSQLEYLRPDDNDYGMQAMGPAQDEQIAKLNELTIIDDNEAVVDALAPMDVDIPLPAERHTDADVNELLEAQQKAAVSGAQRQADVEGAIVLPGSLNEDEGMTEVNKSDDLMKEEDTSVELQLREWRAADYPEDGAERMWRSYETLTHDLAYTLCEQLRLILEPTMATRLKGDYRTGKRLNMKKVISYIASDYTKDKIWLRRTRPSQREYQVLISIDDSRSMAESHSVHLAYQTLALISKALSRLESGDVAIAKFGETVDMLHGFGSGPFSDQAGTKVINAFRFSQKATNVLSLLETSLKVLERARERKAMSSASAADLWQLQIIISDGMCQDHEKLRTMLRKAEEQRVMIVFIILDSLQAGPSQSDTSGKANSILQMDKAEFKNVEGKMVLQLQKYLDSFPFEYYLVLRHVEALPEVLSATLKQFFERISEE